MGHDYGVPLKILSVTPTRDNEEAPGNRLPDKHSRLFCGKTLDEWLMLQLWSSHNIIKKVFVCETLVHAAKLESLAKKYDVELMVRPEQFLHPMNDTGMLPCYWGVTEALKHDYYSLTATPMVVTPCRPPGFFDYMIDQYQARIQSHDYQSDFAQVVGASSMKGYPYVMTGDGKATQLEGMSRYNENPDLRLTNGSHWIGATWWYLAVQFVGMARYQWDSSHLGKSVFFPIEPWQDIHIDTEDDWKEAEFWFKEKILSQGEDCYERYHRS